MTDYILDRDGNVPPFCVQVVKDGNQFVQQEWQHTSMTVLGTECKGWRLDSVLAATLVARGARLGAIQLLRGQRDYSSGDLSAAYNAWLSAGKPETFVWQDYRVIQ